MTIIDVLTKEGKEKREAKRLNQERAILESGFKIMRTTGKSSLLSEEEISLAEAQREKICGSKYIFRFQQQFEKNVKEKNGRSKTI